MATDARRREVYWARYDARPEAAADRARGRHARRAVAAEIPAGTPVAGAGALLYPDLLGEPDRAVLPGGGARLARLAAERLAAGLPGLGAEPMYLRRPDARVPGPPKRVTVP